MIRGYGFVIQYWKDNLEIAKNGYDFLVLIQNACRLLKEYSYNDENYNIFIS